MGNVVIMIISTIVTIINLFDIRRALKAILKANHSKTAFKKAKKEATFGQRIMCSYGEQQTKKFNHDYKILNKLLIFSFFIIVLTIVSIIPINILHLSEQIGLAIYGIKFVIVDLVLIIYLFSKTRQSKNHGGRLWIYEIKDN